MANFRTAMMAVMAAAAMTGSQALAADLSLSPGKPAGVRQAQHGHPNLLLIGAGVTAAVVGIVIATQSSSDAACGAACTVTTSPSTTS
jgi:hypothetical protein